MFHKTLGDLLPLLASLPQLQPHQPFMSQTYHALFLNLYTLCLNTHSAYTLYLECSPSPLCLVNSGLHLKDHFFQEIIL